MDLNRSPSRLGGVALPLVALGVFLTVWALSARYGSWEHSLFPGPLAALLAIWRLALSGELWPAVWATVRRLLYGLGGSLVLGAALGFLMARFVPLRRALKPYLLGLQSLPGMAWVPIAVVWFGFGESFYVFVTLIGSVFAATLLFTEAIAGVPPGFAQVAQTMGARGFTLVSTVAIPAALPSMLIAVRQTWSFAWRSLIGAEIVVASVGLGFLLLAGRDALDTAQIFAVMLVTLAVGILFEVVLFAGAERWLARRWGLAHGR